MEVVSGWLKVGDLGAWLNEFFDDIVYKDILGRGSSINFMVFCLLDGNIFSDKYLIWL